MSSLFGNLSADGLEKTEDRLGGYTPFESDIYVGTIKAMYAGESRNGAVSVDLIADIDGREYRETFYVTNRNKENFYITKNDKKAPLPGFTTVDDICLIASGKPLSEQETEEKVVNVWNPDEGKEMPKSVPMLVECIGQPIALGILKQIENKSTKMGDKYVATEETREINVVDKVFHPEVRLTVNEARDGKEEPAFWDAWAKKNKGQVRDRTEKSKGGGSAGRPSKAPTAGSTPAPAKSLFSKK